MGEKRNHWPLVNCHVTANFYPRKPILSKPAKGFKSEVFPELGQNQTSRKPCEGTRDREEKKSRTAKLTHTPTEPDDQWEIVPHVVHEEWMFVVYSQANHGPKSRQGSVTCLQFHKNGESG